MIGLARIPSLFFTTGGQLLLTVCFGRVSLFQP